jgi:hypothetical protein
MEDIHFGLRSFISSRELHINREYKREFQLLKASDKALLPHAVKAEEAVQQADDDIT